MTLLVIDASVAIKWFVSNEPGRIEALRILDRVRDDPSHFAVPELFFNEMLAVLVRLAGDDGTAVRGHLEALQNLGFDRIGNGGELLATAAEIACRYHISGYDSVYAASAQLTGGRWLTADARAHKKIQQLRISRAVCLG